MKAPLFRYARPHTLDAALKLLAEAGEGARLLAGGQSLVPALNMRLLEPTSLIDINGLSELAGIAETASGIRVGALFEECLYDERGQLLNGTLVDYLVPMASEMPDIVVDHVETPTSESLLGAKGAGEAGTGGAPAAVMNAMNDALMPLKARVTSQPISPRRILAALGKA